MGILFSQSDHTYCRIPAWDFKYKDRQNFVKQMAIKQANISERYTGVRTILCGSACIQVVPPDPKVHKLATRSTCMDGGRISNKLVIPKSICLSTFYSYRESASQSNDLTCLKLSEDWAHCIITKRGGERIVAGVFQEKLIPFLQV